MQLANPVRPERRAGRKRSNHRRDSTTTGFSLQATNTDQLFGHNNHFVVGTSFDYSVTHFTASAELGTIGPNYVVSGSGIFLGNPAVRFRTARSSLRTTNQYTGLYALDTFDVTNRFSITGGGRFNVANINLQDQLGTALNGNDTYTRFNPIIGGTYKITSGLTAYAGYSEANRAPTPLELGCADPANPCIIASFLVSDPPLKQVVSHTVEAGFRGTGRDQPRHARLESSARSAPTIPTTSSTFPARSCKGSAISRMSARPAARASRPKSPSSRTSCSSTPATLSSTRAS